MTQGTWRERDGIVVSDGDKPVIGLEVTEENGTPTVELVLSPVDLAGIVALRNAASALIRASAVQAALVEHLPMLEDSRVIDVRHELSNTGFARSTVVFEHCGDYSGVPDVTITPVPQTRRRGP